MVIYNTIAVVGLRFNENMLDILYNDSADYMRCKQDGVFDVWTLDHDVFSTILKFKFIVVRDYTNLSISCAGMVVILTPLFPITELLIDSILRIRDYNTSISNRTTFPILLAYRNESTYSYAIEDVCTATMEYFTTKPISVLYELCKQLYPPCSKFDLTTYIHIDISIIFMGATDFEKYIIDPVYVSSNIVLSFVMWRELSDYYISTQLGLICISTYSNITIHVSACARHDIDYMCSHLLNINITIILLISNRKCDITDCKYECNKLKSTYHRTIERTYGLFECIPVYDCNALDYILSIVCNRLHVDFIPFTY